MHPIPDISILLYLHLDGKIKGRDLDCLTLVYLQGFSRRQAAKRLEISHTAVNKCLRKVSAFCAKDLAIK